MTFTPLTKPATSSWTDTNPIGRTEYNQSSITYDDSTVFYDGLDPNSWTSLTKPTIATWTPIAKPI